MARLKRTPKKAKPPKPKCGHFRSQNRLCRAAPCVNGNLSCCLYCREDKNCDLYCEEAALALKKSRQGGEYRENISGARNANTMGLLVELESGEVADLSSNYTHDVRNNRKE